VGSGNNSESRGWIGFVESRLRRFIPLMESLPVKMPIQLYPVTCKTQKSSYSVCYFIGFNFDLDAIKNLPNKDIHIDECVYRFQENLFDPDRGYRGNHFEGMDFFVEHIPWKKLPKEVFEPIGGRDAAKAMRQSTYGMVHNSGRKRRNSLSSPPPAASEIVNNGLTAGAEDVTVDVPPAAPSVDNEAVAMNLDAKFAVANEETGGDNEEKTGDSEAALLNGGKNSLVDRGTAVARRVLPRLTAPSPVWQNKQPFIVSTVTWSLLE